MTEQKVRLQIDKLTDKVIDFTMIGASCELANAVRDMIAIGVPVARIDSVLTITNLSLTVEEQWAAVLRLLPIQVKPKDGKSELAFVDQCNCLHGDCAMCSIPFELNVKHETVGDDLKTILASDIHFSSSVFDCTIPDTLQDQPLAVLSRDQVVHLKGFVRKGLGADDMHASYFPTANNPSLRAPPVVILDQKRLATLNSDQLKMLVNTCPTKVFDIEDTKLVAKRPQNCTHCGVCMEKVTEDCKLGEDETGQRAIEVTETEPYSLYVEAKPGMDPLYILEQALTSLSARLQQFL